MDTLISSNTTEVAFNISSFIQGYLASAEHSWSIGISGAIGEFMYDEDEQVDIEVAETEICVITRRGAMRFHIASEIKCIAYEEPSPCIKSWSQSVAFCIPESAALCKRNNVLTEMGVDQGAVMSSSREKLMFDIGVDSAYLQFCIRTDDNELIEILRNNCGRSILEQENPASKAILKASPTRVIISGLGRLEIESKIPVSASETLVGPHTHLLPALLKSKKSSFVGLPEGYVEAFTLYPEHPVFDKYGQGKAFSQSAHDDFQNLLNSMGSRKYLQEKNRLRKEMSGNPQADEITSGESSWQRHAFRIAKMQAPLLKNLC